MHMLNKLSKSVIKFKYSSLVIAQGVKLLPKLCLEENKWYYLCFTTNSTYTHVEMTIALALKVISEA